MFNDHAYKSLSNRFDMKLSDDTIKVYYYRLSGSLFDHSGFIYSHKWSLSPNEQSIAN